MNENKEAMTNQPDHESLLSGIRVDGVWVTHSQFTDKGFQTEGPPEPSTINDAGAEMRVETEARVRDHEEDDGYKLGFVSLTVTVIPNLQPSYEVSVTCLAHYTFGRDASLERDKFLRRNGIAMLFPFVRERIASITGQSRFGRFLLPAVNVARLPQLLVEEQREQRKREHLSKSAE